jgi:hypothetical protein
LHVLSTPPAFVLSQDQTLQRKNLTTLAINKQIHLLPLKHKRHWHTNTLLSSQKTNPARKPPLLGCRTIVHIRQRVSNLLFEDQLAVLAQRPTSNFSWSRCLAIWQTGRPHIRARPAPAGLSTLPGRFRTCKSMFPPRLHRPSCRPSRTSEAFRPVCPVPCDRTEPTRSSAPTSNRRGEHRERRERGTAERHEAVAKPDTGAVE